MRFAGLRPRSAGGAGGCFCNFSSDIVFRVSVGDRLHRGASQLSLVLGYRVRGSQSRANAETHLHTRYVLHLSTFSCLFVCSRGDVARAMLALRLALLRMRVLA